MSTMVKVWNRNIYDHKEMFKGELISIPAGKFVEMEYLDGEQFAGQFSGMPPSDHPQPERFHKKIVVEKPGQPLFLEEDASRQINGETKPAETSAIVEALKSLAQPKESEEVAALKRQVEALTALVHGQQERKKLGPKSKEKVA